MSDEEFKAKYGTLADGDEIPPSDEDITQEELPINPEEEAAADSAEEVED